MSDAGDIEDIREQRKEQLRSRAGAPREPVHVEDGDHLEELLSDHDVVLADFYADWCGPCEMLEPTVESVAESTSAAVAKVDINAHQELATRYQVQGVPTLYLFVDGEPEDRMVGVQDEETLVEAIEAHA
ncbi:thioredoxin [Halobacteriales archaeon QS_8_69_73]|nr:MAG: thioredoxin [Halobacteriales archaeon QS_8_69_73]